MEDKDIIQLLNDSHGILLNANDFFDYASADAVLLDVQDFVWAIPIYKKYGTAGYYAIMAFIEKKDPLPPYITEKYEEAMQELKELNPKIYS